MITYLLFKTFIGILAAIAWGYFTSKYFNSRNAIANGLTFFAGWFTVDLIQFSIKLFH